MNDLEIAGVATPPHGAAHVRLPYVRVRGEADLYRILDPDGEAPANLLRLRERELEGPDFVTWNPGGSPYQPGTSLFVASEDLLKELNRNRHASEAFSRFLKRLRASSSSELPYSHAGGGYRTWIVRGPTLYEHWAELAEGVISRVESEASVERRSFFKFEEGRSLLRAVEMVGLLLDRESELRCRALKVKERILETTDASGPHEHWLATKKAIVKRWREVDFPDSKPEEQRRSTPVVAKWYMPEELIIRRLAMAG